MKLSLILENYPGLTENGECRLWINPKDKGLYFDKERVFFNYDDIDSPATIGDLDRELSRKNYFALETKFIDSSGDLVLNTLKSNIDYNKRTNKITYKLSETMDLDKKKIGVTLRSYKRMEVDYLNNNSAIKSIDLLDGTESCKIVFPGDRVTSVSLAEIAKKFVVPGISCVLDKLYVSYLDPRPGFNDYITNKVYEINPRGTNGIILFSYNNERSENEWRRIYNTSLSDEYFPKGFVLDITEDGLLSLYLSKDRNGNTLETDDYYIESCSIKLQYKTPE